MLLSPRLVLIARTGGLTQAKPGLTRCPMQLDLSKFGAVANAAFGTVFDPPFDPFKDDISFLIATYILEDVGVAACIVRAPRPCCPAMNLQTTPCPQCPPPPLLGLSDQSSTACSIKCFGGRWSCLTSPTREVLSERCQPVRSIRAQMSNLHLSC